MSIFCRTHEQIKLVKEKLSKEKLLVCVGLIILESFYDVFHPFHRLFISKVYVIKRKFREDIKRSMVTNISLQLLFRYMRNDVNRYYAVSMTCENGYKLFVTLFIKKYSEQTEETDIFENSSHERS